MDLTTIETALADFYATAGYLPRPPGLAQTVFDAIHSDPDSPDSPWYLTGVVVALWPIGAAAGAQRGHTVTVAAFRHQVAQALTDTSLDARGRFVVTGLVQAADNLPPGPDPARSYIPAAGMVGNPRQNLTQALHLGLANAWVVGHRHETERVIRRFHADVCDLVGNERLTTTFLAAALPAYAALEEIEFAAYTAALQDREDPTSQPTPAGESVTPPPVERSPAARGFVPLGRVDPARRISTKAHIRPSTGPGRPGPGR